MYATSVSFTTIHTLNKPTYLEYRNCWVLNNPKSSCVGVRDGVTICPEISATVSDFGTMSRIVSVPDLR